MEIVIHRWVCQLFHKFRSFDVSWLRRALQQATIAFWGNNQFNLKLVMYGKKIFYSIHLMT